MNWNAILDPGVLSIVLGATIPIVAIVGHYACRVASQQAGTDLARQMIERGMSAGEIERVLKASGVAAPAADEEASDREAWLASESA